MLYTHPVKFETDALPVHQFLTPAFRFESWKGPEKAAHHPMGALMHFGHQLGATSLTHFLRLVVGSTAYIFSTF